MGTLINLGILFMLDIATRVIVGMRRALRNTAPILILGACCLFGAAARAQNGGYMRVVTSRGQMAGESTDPKYPGWILLHQATLPSAAEVASMADEAGASSADSSKLVHRPAIVVKDRDAASLALLAAYSGHQHFSEIDIVVAPSSERVTARYKLIDATIISDRASGTDGGTHEPWEQLRISYAMIAIE